MLHISHFIGSADEKKGLEQNTDDVSITFHAVTETGLAAMLDGDVSHDPITRFFIRTGSTFKDLWNSEKSTVISQKAALRLFLMLFPHRPCGLFDARLIILFCGG